MFIRRPHEFFSDTSKLTKTSLDCKGYPHLKAKQLILVKVRIMISINNTKKPWGRTFSCTSRLSLLCISTKFEGLIGGGEPFRFETTIDRKQLMTYIWKANQ